MFKLTPWFNAKSHSPMREGWYDCKECNARHYFKEGVWYRNKKSLRDGPMTIREMHWRGLARSSVHELDDGGLFVKNKSVLDLKGMLTPRRGKQVSIKDMRR